MMGSVRLLLLALFAGIAQPLAAQVLRADVIAANRHIWRGVNRTTRWISQMQVATMAPIGRGAVAVGVFENRELGESGPGDLTEVGRTRKGLGERDWWIEYRRPLGSQEIFTGVTRYTFHGDRQLGGRSPADNTTELSFGFNTKLTYFSPTFVAHWDVDRIQGVYLEASGVLPLLVWPFPPQVNVLLDAGVGLSLGQGPDPAHPEQLTYYAGDGFTHISTGLSVDLHQGERFSTAIGARLQAGIDDRARLGADGRRRNLFVAYWLGTTLRLGGPER
jgi:hypothetical protein